MADLVELIGWVLIVAFAVLVWWPAAVVVPAAPLFLAARKLRTPIEVEEEVTSV